MTTRDAAHDLAQRLLREMCEQGVQDDPNHPLTIAYAAAERVCDALDGHPAVDGQWERSKAAMDELISDDLGAGDIFVFPAGVGR